MVQDDPKSQKKFIYVSKFSSSIRGEHDFILKLALNLLANAVENGRSSSKQEDESSEMLAFIKV